MASLTKCLNSSKLSADDKAAIRAEAKNYREEDMAGETAAIAATDDIIARTLEEREAIVAHIEAAGGKAPPAPQPPTVEVQKVDIPPVEVQPTAEDERLSQIRGAIQAANDELLLEFKELDSIYERAGVDRLERNRIKPEGLNLWEWVDKLNSQQSEWKGSRKTQDTGIQMLSRKGMWTDEPALEDLRKGMLSFIRKLRKAPGYSPNTFQDYLAPPAAKLTQEPVKPSAAAKLPVINEVLGPPKKPTQAEVAALPLAGQKKWLLGEVEEAAKAAKPSIEYGKGNWRDYAAPPVDAGFVTFEVPGDGKFKVMNVRERLKDFASDIRRTTGFTQKKGGETTPKRTGGGAISQSVWEFMQEGEWMNAFQLVQAADIPHHFGRGGDDRPAILYINSETFEKFGNEFMAGKTVTESSTKRGATFTEWTIIHKPTGLSVISGSYATKAQAMAEFKKSVGSLTQAEFDAKLKAAKPKPASQDILRKRFEETTPEFSRRPHGSARTASAALAGGSVVDQVQSWTAPVQLTWANGIAPSIMVVADRSALPAAVQALAEDDANGAYYEGTIYLIASNISSRKEALEVLAHETIGHHSMNDIVDDWPAMSAEITKIASTPRGKAIQSQVRLRYGDLSPVNYTKEFLAVASEQQLTQGRLADLMQRIRAAIRRFLDKVGLKGLWSSTQLDALLVRAGKNLNEGMPHQDLVAALPDAPMFSKTPHHRQVEDPDLQSLIEKTNPQPAAWWRKYVPSFDSANVRQGLAAEFHSLLLLDQSAGVTDIHQSSHAAARMSTSPETQMWVSLIKHPLKWAKGEVGLDTGNRGLLNILQPVADQIDMFSAYLAARRATRLLREGREFLITKEEAIAGLKIGQDNPAIVTAAEEWYAFNSAMLDFAQEAGYINAESRAMWNETDYVPFYRLMDEGAVGKPAKGKGLQTGSIKRLKGSERGVNNILENMLMNTQHLISAGMREHALGLARDRMEDIGMARKVPLKSMPALVQLGQVRKLLEQDTGPFAEIREWMEEQGIDASGIPDHALQQIQQMWALTVPKGKDIVQIRRNGKPEWYKVDDPLLLRSLTAVNKEALGAWMKLFTSPRRLLTTMVTATPTFQLRNWLRDTGAAFVLSRHKVVPIASGVTGLVDAVKQDPLFWKIMAQGGGFHSGFVTAGDPEGTRKVIEKEMRHKGVGRKIASAPRKLWDAWMQVGSAVENSNRMAIAKSVVKEGGSDLMAAFEAKDFMDFSQRGDWPILNFLTQTIPFLNARIQGNYRLYRGAGIAKKDRENLLIRANPKGFATHGLLITLATLALWFINKDDDRYRGLEEYDKDLHWHFWVGDSHIKIPKPFEVGILFGSMPERAFTAAYEGSDDAAKVMLDRMGWAATQVFEVNPLNIQVLKPIIEQVANREFFFDRPIEGLRMQGELAKYRRAPWTHLTSVEIGKRIGVSPARLDHLVRGYTGSIGNYVMSMSDAVMRAAFDYPAAPSSRIDDYPLIRAVYSGSPTRGTKFKTEFYDMFKASERAFRSLNAARRAGDVATAADIQKEYAKDLAVRSVLTQHRAELSAVYKETRRIYDHKAMTSEKKRELLDVLTARKNVILRRAVGLAKKVRAAVG